MYYYNEMKLSDGRRLFIEFDAHEVAATFHDPGESDESDPRFFIDGDAADWTDVPDEITAEIIEELKSNATADPDYYFDPPDEFD
jgi:hypothetical protein